MLLKLAYYGHPILRQKATQVSSMTQEIKQLVSDMIETLLHLKNGIGIAAPQLHHSLAIFVVQFPVKGVDGDPIPGAHEVFINPKILEVSDTKDFHSEGCLSIPGLYKEVERPVKIKVQAEGLDGITFLREYVGFEARMILHENDHLNGILFIDRLKPKERKAIDSRLKAIKKKYSK